MPDENKPEGQTPTPPWGEEEANFDAARAWALIQSLRQEVTDEKAKTTTERQAREAAEAKAADADPEGKLKAAEERAEKAERAVELAKILRDYPALDGFEDLLTGKTPEELKSQAERLASLKGPQTPEGDKSKGDKSEGEGEMPPADTTPKPSLTPGHGGTDPKPFDPAAIAKAARR